MSCQEDQVLLDPRSPWGPGGVGAPWLEKQLQTQPLQRARHPQRCTWWATTSWVEGVYGVPLGGVPAVWGARPVHTHTTHTSPLQGSGWRQGWDYRASPNQTKQTQPQAVKAWVTSLGGMHQNCKRVPPYTADGRFMRGRLWNKASCTAVRAHLDNAGAVPDGTEGGGSPQELGLGWLSEPPPFADSSQLNPQWCFYDYLNFFLYVDLYPSYLRHVGVEEYFYNSWCQSKKTSGTSSILDFPAWRMAFGRVLQQPSGHLELTVCSSAPKGIPLQESPSSQSAAGSEVHSFTGIIRDSHWKPSNHKARSEAWGPSRRKWSDEWPLLVSEHWRTHALGSSKPLWTPLTMLWAENITQKTIAGEPLLNKRHRWRF